MRFAVRRTSDHDEEQQPCPGAVEGTLPVWDRRVCKSFEEFDLGVGLRNGESWLGKGTEHQVIYGRGGATGIKRRIRDRTAWFIDFASLEDLMAFYAEHGDLVITGAFGCDEPLIEIYDDYRE